MKWRIRTNGLKNMMRGMRWGIMTTNYSESVNNIFKGIRNRPVVGITEYSFEKCNEYFVKRWRNARDLLDKGCKLDPLQMA
jgi:hypothetical protein